MANGFDFKCFETVPSIEQGLLPGRRDLPTIAYTATFSMRGKVQVKGIKQFVAVLEMVDFVLEVYSKPEIVRTYGARDL